MRNRLQPSSTLHLLGRQALLTAVYLLAAGASRLLAVPGAAPGGLWLCSGLAIAALTLGGLRLWPGVLAGAVCLFLFRFGWPGEAAGLWGGLLAQAPGKTLEAVLAAWLLRRAAPHPLDTLWGVFRFLGIIMTSALVGAVTGTASLACLGTVPPEQLAAAAWTWWLGHVASAALLVPLCLAWADARAVARLSAGLGQGIVLAAAFFALCLAVFVVPGAGTPSRLAVFLAFPGIAVAAYAFGGRGASTAVLLVAACAVAGATRGHGPFSGGSPIDLVVGVDSIIAFCAAIGMALAADRIERAQADVARTVTRDVLPWAALLGAVAVTVGGWALIARDTDQESAGRFAARSDQLRWRLQARMQEYERMLRGGVALFAAAARVDRTGWHDFVASQEIPVRLPGVQGIGYVARVRATERARFAQAVRGEGFGRFEVFPQGERPEYMPVLYIEPFDQRNRRSFGFDVYSEPARRQAMDAARDSGRAVLTDRVRLVQEDAEHPQAGFLLYLPVYRKGAATQTLAQRRAALAGFVFSPFRVGDLVNGILQDDWPDLRVQVYDGDAPLPEALLHGDPAFAAGGSARPAVRYADLATPILGHALTLRVQATPAFEATVDRKKEQLVLLAGVVVSLLMFGTVRAQTLMGERATVLARRMTRELAASQARYRLLYEASPAMLHSIDRQGRLVAVSDAWLQRLGYRREQVLGRACVDFLSPQSRLRAHELAPPERSWTGQCVGIEYQMVCQDGTLIDVLLSAVVLPGEEAHALGFLEDITDRRRAEREAGAARARAREVNERLAAIVATSGEAIISQSLNGMIETWNRGAAALFGYLAEEIVGRSVRTLLPPDRIDEEQRLVERVVGGEAIVQHQTIRLHRDGSRLDVAVTLSPICGAEGRLVGISKVVRDVTPQRLLRELQERQAAILQCAGVSIIATDTRGIIQSFNAEAERMLGFGAQEVTGTSLAAMIHVPREVQARAQQLSAQLGVYVPANFEALFAWARRGAVDQREWTYLRRDGSALPVSVSVSATRAGDGQINGFICIAIDHSARKAHEELQRTALLEKETLLKEVYHRVKNNLQVVSSLFNLQLRGLPAGTARATLQQSADRVRAMALVHEKLCRSNNLETIDILAYVRDLCESLAAATGAGERGITVALDIEPLEIGLDASVPLGLLLNELICNSLKHAFPDGRGGTVRVRLAQDGRGAARLEVGDDGIGIAHDRAGARPASLGLRLAATLARQLGGTLHFGGGGGTCVTLSFPLGDGMRTVRLERTGAVEQAPAALAAVVS